MNLKKNMTHGLPAGRPAGPVGPREGGPPRSPGSTPASGLWERHNNKNKRKNNNNNNRMINTNNSDNINRKPRSGLWERQRGDGPKLPIYCRCLFQHWN